MMSYFHHLFFEPTSAWEQTRATIVLTPFALAVFVVLVRLSVKRGKR